MNRGKTSVDKRSSVDLRCGNRKHWLLRVINEKILLTRKTNDDDYDDGEGSFQSFQEARQPSQRIHFTHAF